MDYKKITRRNYFSPNNGGLSNSKVGDWLKDKRYFFEKHVLNTQERTISDALIQGSAVDCWLTEGEKKFNEKYYIVTRRSKKADDYEYQLPQAMYDKIVKMCRRVEAQDAWKDLKGFKKQKILQLEVPIGDHFHSLIGIPDMYKISKDGKRCTIVDLKTAKTVDAYKYHYHCLEFGYYRQQAFYQFILAGLYPDIMSFDSYHIVVEKDRDSINNVRTFLLSQDKISEEKADLLETLGEIKEEKKFLAQNVSWSDAITIGEYHIEADDDFVDIDEDE